jgi:signal transduction histidine kinase
VSTGCVLLGVMGSASATGGVTGVWLAWLLLGLAGCLAAGLFMVALSRTIYRHRRQTPVAVWIVVTCSALSGLIVTWTIMVLAPLTGIESGFGTLDQFVVVGLLSAYGACMLILLFDYRDRTSTARKTLIEQAVQLELEALQRTTIAAQLQEQLAADVAAELSTARIDLEARLRLARDAEGVEACANPREWIEISALLRDTAQSAIRPLSARMWQQSAEDYPRQSGWVIIPNIVRGQPFRPLLIIFIHVLGGLKDALALFGTERAVALIGAQCLCILVICEAANALMRRYPAQHARIFIGGLVLLQGGVFATVQVREAWLPGSASGSWALVQVVVGTAVVFLTSGFGAWRQFDADSRDLFRDRVRRNQVASIARSRQLAELARQASRVLHGSVQTRLHSCAMAIDGASAAGDEQGRIKALHEAMTILAQPLREDRTAGSARDEVQRKVDLWGALCEFTIDVEDDGSGPESLSETVGRIIEEGISNAMRHGQAARIDIRVTIANGMCQVELTDNGIGPGSGKPGIGSALLHQSSGGDWTLTGLEQGSRLSVAVRQ